jgi:Nif-specific regulatory protein
MNGSTVEVRTARAPQGLFSNRAAVALHGVYEISKILSLPARLEVTLSNVLTLLGSFLDLRHGLIAILNAEGAPEIVVGQGWREANAHTHFERLPERAVGQIVATKMPLVVEDVSKDRLFTGWEGNNGPERGTWVSFIGVPIKERDRVIGTLTIDRELERQLAFRSDEDVRFLSMIANLVGQTVRLHEVVQRDRERLLGEQGRLEKELSETGRGQRQQGQRVRGIIGESQAIHAVLDKVHVVAPSNATVLLRGESGTGKELFASAIHSLSTRSKGPFVKLNCAALPESVLESELFGHEKGAFTGAISQRKGRFELADGGTLFLDEIGEISPTFQAKLLRVLQEGEFERVGGMRTLKVNVRLIAATNKNLEDAVAQGNFRADLYYRINVVTITLPALRERPEDIFVLAREFLRRFSEENGAPRTFAASAKDVLEHCYFPGNVRELENCVRRTATMAKGTAINADDFACRHNECLSSTLWKAPLPIISRDSPRAAASSFAALDPVAPSLPEPLSEVVSIGLEGDPRLGEAPDGQSERERLIQAMKTAGWVQAKAARLLNLTPRQIGYALRKHGIPIKKF